MAYASPADLAKLLGKSGFTTVQTDRAELLLDLATGEIERAIGQTLVDGVEDRLLTGPGTDKLILPRWPVTEVTSVKDVDADTGVETALTYRADYTWDQDGILTRVGGVWPCHDKSVHVVFRAGFETISDDVRRICLAMVRREWGNPAAAAEESLGDHSIKHDAVGMDLTDRERSTLRTYQAKTYS